MCLTAGLSVRTIAQRTDAVSPHAITTRVPESMVNIELLQPKMSPTGSRRVPATSSLEGAFEAGGYLSMFSDVVALMLPEYQAEGANVIRR